MKETLRRAVRTFFQAAIGYLSANIVYVVSSGTDFELIKTGLMTVGLSAIAAGLAALMNLPAKESEETK